MTKRAEEAALKAYPMREEYTFAQRLITNDMRDGFIHGYEQAEKDYIELAQLWVGSGSANIMSFKQFLKCHETQSNK